jgi:hypothetical protein
VKGVLLGSSNEGPNATATQSEGELMQTKQQQKTDAKMLDSEVTTSKVSPWWRLIILVAPLL